MSGRKGHRWARGDYLRALAFISATVVAYLAAATPASAQQYHLATFDAGGVTHFLYYAEGREKAIQAIQEGVDHTFEVLQPLWAGIGGKNQSTSLGFQFFVVLRAETPPPGEQPGTFNLATASMRSPAELPPGATSSFAQVCRVDVYNTWPGPDVLFTIAHEIAHCYQSHYAPSAPVAGPNRSWWIEGSADWMAALAYPAGAWQYLNGQEYFLGTHHQTVFGRSYDAIYFWSFLTGPTGLGSVQAVIEFLRNMPAPQGGIASYVAHLTAAAGDLDRLFHNYALAIGQNHVVQQPQMLSADPLRSAAENWVTGDLPDIVQVSTEPYSIRFYRVTTPHIASGNGIRFEALDLENSGLRVSVVAAGGMSELEPGTPLDFCFFQPYWHLAVSLAAPRAGAVDGQIRLTEMTKEECEGKPNPIEVANMPVIPNCLAGDWIVSTIPDLAGILPLLDPAIAGQTSINQHTILFSLAGDGAWRTDFTIRASTPQATTIIHAVIAGSLGLQPSTVRGNSYDVRGANGSIVPGTASGLVQVGGIQVDVTNTLAYVFESPGNLLPFPTYLTCGDDGSLLYVVVVDGVEQTWVMRRP